MKLAFLWSERSLDPRRKVGAVVTSPDLRRILGIGYNGPAKGLPPSFIRSEPGNSGCLHAEENALLTTDFSVGGKVMFTTDEPCELCAQRIVNAGVVKVYYSRQYRTHEGLHILHQCKVKVIHFHEARLLP